MRAAAPLTKLRVVGSGRQTLPVFRSSLLPLCLSLIGVAVMVAASLWAPPQPELLNSGAACQFAPCGTLEDPARSRVAWWVWTGGVAVLIGAVSLLVGPLPRLRPVHAAVAALIAPVWVAVTGVVAVVISLFTSVHGAATVAACGLLIPLLALLAGVAKRPSPPQVSGEIRRRPRGSSAHDQQ